MTVSLHDTGEEYILDVVMDGTETRVTSVTIGLYNDGTDALTDSSDVGDITTEPTGSAYARQTVTLDATDVTNSDVSGDWESEFVQQTFDVSDSSQDVDAYFVVVNFDSDDAGDAGTATDHLFFTGTLDQSYNLGQIDTFNLDSAGVSIT